MIKINAPILFRLTRTARQQPSLIETPAEKVAIICIMIIVDEGEADRSLVESNIKHETFNKNIIIGQKIEFTQNLPGANLLQI